jgi:hypothetical protein
MKTISFFVLIAITIGSTAAQRPYDYDYREDRNQNRGYNLPNDNYSNLNNLRIDELQREVYFKINRGIQNGQLNRREAQYLSRAFGEIEQKSRWFRADGFLSRQEERELRDDLLTLNDQVRYEKHDDEYRRDNYRRGNRNYGRNQRSW